MWWFCGSAEAAEFIETGRHISSFFSDEESFTRGDLFVAIDAFQILICVWLRNNKFKYASSFPSLSEIII